MEVSFAIAFMLCLAPLEQHEVYAIYVLCIHGVQQVYILFVCKKTGTPTKVSWKIMQTMHWTSTQTCLTEAVWRSDNFYPWGNVERTVGPDKAPFLCHSVLSSYVMCEVPDV